MKIKSSFSQASRSNSLHEIQEIKEYVKLHHRERIGIIQNMANSTEQTTQGKTGEKFLEEQKFKRYINQM